MCQGLAFALPGMFSDMTGNSFPQSKKLIVCPELDKLIAECPACHLGLPKALLPDTDDADNPTYIAGRRERSLDKQTQFGKSYLYHTLKYANEIISQLYSSLRLIYLVDPKNLMCH